MKIAVPLFRFSFYRNEVRNCSLKNPIRAEDVTIDEYCGGFYSVRITQSLKYSILSSIFRRSPQETNLENLTPTISKFEVKHHVSLLNIDKIRSEWKPEYHNLAQQVIDFLNEYYKQAEPQLVDENTWKVILEKLRERYENHEHNNYYLAAVIQTCFPLISGWRHVSDSDELYLLNPEEDLSLIYEYSIKNMKSNNVIYDIISYGGYKTHLEAGGSLENSYMVSDDHSYPIEVICNGNISKDIKASSDNFSGMNNFKIGKERRKQERIFFKKSS